MELSVAPVKQKSIGDACEKILVSNDFQPVGELFEQIASVPKKASTSSARPLAYKRINLIQNRQNSNNSTFGRVPVVKEDDTDSRIHYSAFLNCIDLSDNAIMQRMVYDCNRLRTDEDEQCSTPLTQYDRKSFHLFMSANYLKQTYDLEVRSDSDYRNMLRYQQELKNVLPLDLDEMMRYPNGRRLDAILKGNDNTDDSFECDETQEMNTGVASFDETLPEGESIRLPSMCNNSTLNTTPNFETDSGIESTVPSSMISIGDSDQSMCNNATLNTTPNFETDSGIESTIPSSTVSIGDSDQSMFNNSTLNTTSNFETDSGINSTVLSSTIHNDNSDQVLDQELQRIAANSASTQLISSRNPSIDEGLGSFCSMSVRSDPMYSPVVELFDILGGIGDSMSVEAKRSITIKLDDRQMNNIFGIRDEYLQVVQQFNLPSKLFERDTPLTVNVLRLPEAKLRRRKLFELTEEFNIWKNTVSLMV